MVEEEGVSKRILIFRSVNTHKMSVKVKQAIVKCLSQIESKTFDEYTIRTLLIVSREYIGNEGLMKELAHFIAHPVRNQGMFHRKMNSRYAKLNLVDEQVSKLSDKTVQARLKKEDDLSDFMLGAISVEKIDSKLFKVLYSDGLEDMPESHLVKYAGFNKLDAKSILENAYVKKDGFHYLKTNSTEKLIKAFNDLPNSKYDPIRELELAEQIKQMGESANKIKKAIDRIQKVIRGVIYFTSVFEKGDLSVEIQSALLRLIEQFDIDRKYIKVINDNIDDILLCIMTLLHDCKFVFYDKNEARTFLCFYLATDDMRISRDSSEVSKILYDDGVIALYMSYKSWGKTMTFPFFVSNLAVKNYMSKEVYDANASASSMAEVGWVTASRINNALMLTDEV